jgi:probable phosphoglycerate mutase
LIGAVPRAKPTPPTVVLFVRHGETPTTGKILSGQAPGLHLSDRGREQAKATAASIAALGSVAAVFTSPMERARETAAAIGEATGIEPEIIAGLADSDAGDWTGRELRSVAKLPEWRTVVRHPSGFRFPGGESFSEVVARVSMTVDRLVEEHPGQTVVAVSHADPIRVAVGSALGSPLDLFDRIVVGTASVSAIAYTRDGPRVFCVNADADGLPVPRPRPRTRRARKR